MSVDYMDNYEVEYRCVICGDIQGYDEPNICCNKCTDKITKKLNEAISDLEYDCATTDEAAEGYDLTLKIMDMMLRVLDDEYDDLKFEVENGR